MWVDTRPITPPTVSHPKKNPPEMWNYYMRGRGFEIRDSTSHLLYRLLRHTQNDTRLYDKNYIKEM